MGKHRRLSGSSVRFVVVDEICNARKTFNGFVDGVIRQIFHDSHGFGDAGVADFVVHWLDFPNLVGKPVFADSQCAREAHGVLRSGRRLGCFKLRNKSLANVGKVGKLWLR